MGIVFGTFKRVMYKFEKFFFGKDSRLSSEELIKMSMAFFIVPMVLKALIWILYSSLAGSLFLVAKKISSHIFQTFFHVPLPLRKKREQEEDEEKKIQTSSEGENRETEKDIEKNYERDVDSGLIPREIIPCIRRAEALIARKEFQEAKKVLINALSLDQDNTEASYQLGFTYLQTGDFIKAETLFFKVLQKRPRDPALLTNYALSIFEQKEPSRVLDSIEALKKATELDSKNAHRYSNLGQSYYFFGDIPSAISAFKQAIHLDPKNIEYHFFLADSFLSLQQFSEAKSTFEKILKLCPTNEEALQEIKELEKKGV
jgi:tetratricopeptide (TPR) repeat protein